VFLRNFEKDNCYDRFAPSEATTSTTRQLFSGYSYAVVGSGWFFDSHIRSHFRRHYFQMALLAHFESASLLNFSNRISHAVHRYASPRDRKSFEAAILGIEDEHLQFVHRFRFTGISNQVQPQEMYMLWRKHLRLDELHVDITQELESATSYIFAKDQMEQTNSATYLSIIATIGLLLGLAAAVLGANVLFREGVLLAGPENGANQLVPIAHDVGLFASVVLLVTLCGSMLTHYIMPEWDVGDLHKLAKIQRVVIALSAVGAAVAFWFT
jgi:hypothetical protein